MRTLERNKRTFHYATYSTSTELLDANGDHTYEYTPVYSTWVSYRANISPARGESSAEIFGADIEYDKIIITDDLACPIEETSVLAIDMSVDEGDAVADWDYIVTKKAVSLNFIQYAVKKVEVNELPSTSNGS